MIKPIIEKSNKKNILITVFYDNDNIKINQNKENMIKILKSIVKINSNKQIYPTNEYKETLIKEINNYYLLSQKDIKVSLKKSIPKFYYEMITLYPFRRRIKLIKESFIGSSEDLIIKKVFNSPSYKTIQFLSETCQNLCVPYVVYIPNSNFWRPNSKANEYKIRLQNISNDLGVKFVDGESVVNKNDKKNYASKGGHLSLDGYKKIAELINDSLN